MASPAYRAHKRTTYSADGTSRTVDKPTGTASGDILLCVLQLFTDTSSLSSAATITWPSGFTQIESLYSNLTSGEEIQAACAWKVAGGSEPANYTTSWDNSAGSVLIMVAYSGGYTSDPIDDSDIQAAGSESATTTTPSLTAGAADTLYCAFPCNWYGATWTPATGFSGRAVGPGAAMMIADKAMSATGATGSFDHTASVSDTWIGLGVLLASQATPSTTVKDLIMAGMIPFAR